MAYSFKRSDDTLGAGLRRIASDQLDRALATTAPDADEDPHARVHASRKRVKKLRGLLRIVRPAFGAYSDENRALRDAARMVSSLRDSTALLETYDDLTDRHGEALDLHKTAPFRAQHTRRRGELDASGDVEQRMAAFHDALADVRARVDDWVVETDDPAEVLEAGVLKTAGRAAKALARADDTRDDEDVHELRKRVKYHWYHARLVKRSLRPVLEGRAKAAHRLSDLLGDHHDLAVLEEALGDVDISDEGRVALLGAAALEREHLERAAFPLAHALFAEKPKRLAKRWATWWRIRHEA